MKSIDLKSIKEKAVEYSEDVRDRAEQYVYFDGKKDRRHEHDHRITRVDIACIIFCIILLVILKISAPVGTFGKVVYILPYAVVGYKIVREAIEGIMCGCFFDEYFLMTLASIGAFGIGEPVEAVMIMLLYRIGELFESYAIAKSKSAVRDISASKSSKAYLVTDNGLVKVRPVTVSPGDIICVPKGERVPLNGRLLEELASLDYSCFTGDPQPKTAVYGDLVHAGAVNDSADINIQVTESYKSSTASKFIDILENNTDGESVNESFIGKFAKIYTPIVVFLAVFIGIVPPLFDHNWSRWIESALVFLVVSCPCALVISVPLAFSCGIGRASKDGILFKGSNTVEKFSKADTIVFSKTGCITRGKYKITEMISENMTPDNLILLAAMAEYSSNHPIAITLKQACNLEYTRPLEVSKSEEVPGMGVVATVSGKEVYVGNAALMSSRNIEYKVPGRPGTAVHISCDGQYMGYILLTDSMKPGAGSMVDKLHKLGINSVVMLSGDVYSSVKPLASNLGFDLVKAELSPKGKVDAMKYLKRNSSDDKSIVYVGTCDRGAELMEEADLSVVVDAFGSSSALDNADIVMMDDDPDNLAYARELAAYTTTIASTNIIIALSVKIAILLLGAFGISGVWLAIFGDSGLLVLTILNSLRILIKKF